MAGNCPVVSPGFHTYIGPVLVTVRGSVLSYGGATANSAGDSSHGGTGPAAGRAGLTGDAGSGMGSGTSPCGGGAGGHGGVSGPRLLR